MLSGLLITAQSERKLLTNSGDTVTNTGTVNLSFEVPNAASVVSVELANTKISGTVGGNSIFEGSITGAYYQPIDTLANANQSLNGKVFTDTPSRYRIYRIRNTGTGTMAYKTTATALIRKH